MPSCAKDDAAGQRLQGIPGIGPQGAATIRAELGDILRFGRIDEGVAYAGLDPRTRQSGAFVGQKQLSKRGPSAWRHALYLAAFVAARCAPEWRSRYHRLLDRGRAKKEAYTILAVRSYASSSTCCAPARPTIPRCSTGRRRRWPVDNRI